MDALWQFFNDDVRESAALLDARMPLFFESRHAWQASSRPLCLKLEPSALGIIRCDAPTTRAAYFLPVACGRDRIRAGAPGSQARESHLELTSVEQGFGLPLRSVSAAWNTYTTILDCRCSARLPKRAAHQSLPRPACDVDGL